MGHIPAMQRPARAFAVVATAAVLLALTAGKSAGHPVLVGSDPPDGASLATAPPTVTLTFSEDVSAELSSATLVDAQGHRAALETRTVPDSNAQLVVDLPDIGPGTYRVTWTTVSAVDLHIVSGWTVFAVGLPAAAVGSGQSRATVAWLDGIVAWLLFGSLAVAIGVHVMVLYLLPGLNGAATLALRHRLRRVGVTAVTFALAAGIAGATRSVQSIAALAGPPNPVYAFLETPPGARWLLQEAFLIVALVGLVAWRPGTERSRAGLLASGIALGTVVGVRALGSHQVAATGSSPIEMVAWVLHSGAAAVWVGSLMALGLAVLSGRHGGISGPLLFPLLRRFSPLAALSIAVLAITGIYATGRLVASIDALLFTDYGHLLVAKIALAGCVGVLGFRHALRLHGWIRRLASRLGGHVGQRLAATAARGGSLHLSLRVEAAGGLAVILVAAWLSYAPLADGPEFLPTATRPPTELVATIDDLLITTSVSPGRAGANFVNLGVFETRRPSMAPIDRVDVTIRAPGGSSPTIHLTAQPLGDGRFETPAGTITTAGRWNLTVTVTRPGLEAAVFNAPVDVGAAQLPTRPSVVSNAPIRAPLTILAVALATALGLGIGVARRHRIGMRRRKSPGHGGPIKTDPVIDRITC